MTKNWYFSVSETETGYVFTEIRPDGAYVQLRKELDWSELIWAVQQALAAKRKSLSSGGSNGRKS